MGVNHQLKPLDLALIAIDYLLIRNKIVASESPDLDMDTLHLDTGIEDCSLHTLDVPCDE